MVSDPVERSVDALAWLWTSLAGRVADGLSEDRRGVLRIRSGIPAPTFNGVWVLGRKPDPADVLDAVVFFRAGRLPWNLQLRPGYPSELAAELTGRGLVETAQIPFMVLTDLEQLPASTDLAFRLLATFDDLEQMIDLLERGFAMPPELSRQAMPLIMFFIDGLSTYTALADGVAVSTAAGAISEGVCGIFNVSTPDEHRRRGYGAAVTAEAVRRAWAAGCDVAYLQSSPMGYRVYERLGFTTAELWSQWMPKEYAETE